LLAPGAGYPSRVGSRFMTHAPEFIDAFSDTAERYAVSRPTYPRALFQTLAAFAPSTRSAWDCGTGNG